MYCHQLCPHGAAQEWISTIHRFRRPLSVRWRRLLRALPGASLAGVFVLACGVPAFELARVEPFDAWVLRGASLVSCVLAVVGLVASLFVPMAYCRFACPTGALLNFVRTRSARDRLGRPEWLAALLLLSGAVWVWAGPMSGPSPTGTGSGGLREGALGGPAGTGDPPSMSGRAFGTTWSVRLRSESVMPDGLSARLADELRRLETQLSIWESGSELTRFNESATRLPIELSDEALDLVERALPVAAEATLLHPGDEVAVDGLARAAGGGGQIAALERTLHREQVLGEEPHVLTFHLDDLCI